MKKFLIISILLISSAIISLYACRYKQQPDFPGGGMNKLSGELEHLDNWALSAEKGVYCDSDIDPRARPYAVKMLEESKKHSEDWLPRNSWRFGFWYGDGLLRFVGVFPAEQMYYSGLSLGEYADSQSSCGTV